MSLGHHSAAPTGLGEGSGVVLTMASGFSASTFPKDNMGAAGTHPCLELRGTCASHTSTFGKQLRAVFVSGSGAGRSAGSMWLHTQPLESCVTRPGTRLGSAAAHAGSHPSKNSCPKHTLHQEPGFLVSLPLFVADLREQQGSVTRCQVRWLIIITGGLQMLADKSLQGLM